MPTKFWTRQKNMARIRTRSTRIPPARSSARLAPMPMDVKKATTEGRLHPGVELDVDRSLPQEKDECREQKPANDGGRDVEPVEPGGALAEPGCR